MMVRNGIDNLDGWAELLRGRRVALLTNAAACAADGSRTVDALLENDVNVVQLFSPEHGLAGQADAGADVDDSVDAATGIPVCSLYGAHKEIPHSLVEKFDVLVADLPDVGVRYYTYADTLFHVMESCAQIGCDVVVLDRPSPLGKTRQGPLLDMRFRSDVGAAPVPVRHGFSLGEYARYALNHSGIAAGCKLHLVGYELNGAAGFPDFGIKWRNPSPNLRSFDALCAYTGTCLFEGTNISEGRGTPEPFLTVGAPFVKPEIVISAVNGLPGAHFTPCEFVPQSSKFAGEHCCGVRIQVTDWHVFNGFECGIRLLDAVRLAYHTQFQFVVSHFDHLIGDDGYRCGRMDLEALLKKTEDDCRNFQESLFEEE